EVDGVAIEQTGERLCNQHGDAEMLQCLGRLLARRTDAEVAATDHGITRPHFRGKRRQHRREAVLGDLLDAELHVAAGGDDVGVDVVAEDPGLHASSSRGSAMCPATAEAATVYGEARYTCA